MLEYGHKKPRSKIRFFSDWKCPPPSSWLTSTLEDELKHLGWFSLMPTSILKMRGWRVCAHFELCNSDNQCLSKCIWCEAQQIRLILMKIWTDLTWNSVDNLIIRRAVWWTEALPDLWTGLATQCPAENTVIHESYWHMDVDRYTPSATILHNSKTSWKSFPKKYDDHISTKKLGPRPKWKVEWNTRFLFLL